MAAGGSSVAWPRASTRSARSRAVGRGCRYARAHGLRDLSGGELDRRPCGWRLGDRQWLGQGHRHDLLAHEQLVAVVGTREPTVFGTSAAENLTGALADGGWGIVSGLAKGIDTIAHRTALEHGAPTIAVMGGGLDSVYPAENKDLAARIVDRGGALISEQPFGEQARPQHLIARDRLQSGLSVAVVVAQSGVKSGTMHTARFAAAQGRPLFCPVPHNENAASEGLRVLLERPGRQR